MGNRLYHLSVVDSKPGAVPQRREKRVDFPPPWLTGLDDTASLPSSTPIVDPVSQGTLLSPQHPGRPSPVRLPVDRAQVNRAEPRQTCRSASVRIDAAAMVATPPTPRLLFAPTLVLLLALLAPGVSQAGDYDRNVVLSRELGVGAMMLPVQDAPVAIFARATARKHLRYLYFGGEFSAGLVLDIRPMFSVAGAIGLESANDAWQPLRAYGEAGAGLFWANTSPRELLNLHLEAGVRYLMHAYRRPHLSIHMGVRALTNFARPGGTVVCGATWAFD